MTQAIQTYTPEANLTGEDLSGANLWKADLDRANTQNDIF